MQEFTNLMKSGAQVLTPFPKCRRNSLKADFISRPFDIAPTF